MADPFNNRHDNLQTAESSSSDQTLRVKFFQALVIEDQQIGSLSWHLITGEYPPQRGGVSDYTEQLALALDSAGQNVHVWAMAQQLGKSARVRVHPLTDFGPVGLRHLSQGLAEVPGRKRLLVQYVAPAYGRRGLNLRFASWVANRSSDEVWVHFHEVAYPFVWRQKPKLNLMAGVQWWMAQLVSRRADRVFMSVPGWRRQLGRYGAKAEVLPIPSNVPVDARPAAVEALRAELGPGSIVGHFGTYGALVTNLLEPVAVSLLEAVPSARFLFLGRGGSDFVRKLGAIRPHLARRLLAPGGLGSVELSCYIASCDVLVQPYPDGISGRRTSAMACLALGKPVVTTTGHLTEENWAASGAAVLIPVGRPEELARAVSDLLADPARRMTLGDQAKVWYRARYSIEQTLAVLGVDPLAGRVPI